MAQANFVTTEIPPKVHIIEAQYQQKNYEANPTTLNGTNSMQSLLQEILNIDTRNLNLRYKVCFENNDTKVIYPDGETDVKNVNVTLLFNNQTEFEVPYKSTQCIEYETGRNFTYIWTFESKLNITKIYEHTPEISGPAGVAIRTVTFHPGVRSYPQINFWSFLELYLIVFLAFWGIFFVLRDTWEFIKNGVSPN